MQKYQCHKQVEAAQIASITPAGEDGVLTDLDLGPEGTLQVDANFMAKFSPEVGGYIVKYDGGTYTSYSPKAAFENGYTRVDDLLRGEDGPVMMGMAGAALVGVISSGQPGTPEELAKRAADLGTALLVETKKRVVQ